MACMCAYFYYHLFKVYLTSDGPFSFQSALAFTSDNLLTSDAKEAPSLRRDTRARLAVAYDRLYGQPGPVALRRFRDALAQVRKANQSWPRVFYHWGLPCPTPRALLRCLRHSLLSSLRKGYHNASTDWGKSKSIIPASVLLKARGYKRSVFCVDVSGSMDCHFGQESRLDWVKAQLGNLIERTLVAGQQFNLVLFNHEAKSWEPGFVLLSEATVAHCKSSINAISSGGGTNITKALELAFSLPSVDCVYLVTDGEDQVNIENIAASAREAGARFGIPCVPCHTTSISGASCSMLQELANATGGVYSNVEPPDSEEKNSEANDPTF